MTSAAQKATTTFTSGKWIDEATLAYCKRFEGTAKAPKDFPIFEPVVRPYNASGSEVAVTLCGPRGQGREMILDREVWEDVSARFDRRWFIAKPEGNGEFFVATMSDGQVVNLAKHLTGVVRGMVILHRYRNILDLRRGSLRLVDGLQACSWGNAGNVLPRREKAVDGSTREASSDA